VSGIFEIGDPNFGNLWTNIPLKVFEQAGFHFGDHIQTTIHHAREVVFSEFLLFEKSFGFVKKGEVMIYNNELNMISLAVNQGSLADTYDLSWGPEWEVSFEKAYS
jgi:hypothetical protein